LRKSHPDWEITLYHAPCFTDVKSWRGDIFQDFAAVGGNDYFSRLGELDIEVKEINGTWTPVHGSDLFRYMHLEAEGGVYVDTDIFWIEPIDDVYDTFNYADQVISHSPQFGFQIGLLAAQPGSPLFHDWSTAAFHPHKEGGKHYQSCGVDALICLLAQRQYESPISPQLALSDWLLDALRDRYDNTFVLDGNYLYGVDGGNAQSIFEGNLGDWEPKLMLHLYGGSPTFQWYNHSLTPDNILNHNGPFFDIVRRVGHVR
jgi:hypothetical protein